MNDRTRRIIVFSALPVALIWGYYNLMMKSDGGYIPTANDPSLATVPSIASNLPSTTVSDSATFHKIRSRSWGTDPFRGRTVSHREPTIASSTVAKSGLSWVLNGIIFSETSPLAYVNGRPVKVGEVVNSAKVVSIDRRTVTLEVDGRRLTISLSKEARS
jgi:type II secretory pathway component PulC